MNNQYIENEINKYDWSRLSLGVISAVNVPSSLRLLFAAQTEYEAEMALRKLDNSIVVQGFLYEASPCALRVILVALEYLHMSKNAKESIIELLFQMLAYDYTDLGRECRNIVREKINVINELNAPEILRVLMNEPPVIDWNDPDELDENGMKKSEES